MMSLPLSEEIQKYTVPWLQMDWPIDWPQVFDRSGDLVLEIGFGNGHFLSDMAASRPDACFVGIERAWGSMRRLFKRLNALKLNHVRAIEGDAAFLLQHVFAPQSLSEIWINFSDPWPKERHHNRRLIQNAFVKNTGRAIKTGRRSNHSDRSRRLRSLDHRRTVATIALAIHLQHPICSQITRTHPNQIRTKGNRCGRTHPLFCLASKIGTISRNAHSKGR